MRKTTFHLSAGCLISEPSTVSFVRWTMRVFQKKHLKVRETPFSYQEYDNSSDEMTHTFRQRQLYKKKKRKENFPFPHFHPTWPEKTNSTNPGASTPAPLRCIRFIIISFRLKLFSDGTRTLQNQGHQNVPWVHTGVITRISSGFFLMAWLGLFLFRCYKLW